MLVVGEQKAKLIKLTSPEPPELLPSGIPAVASFPRGTIAEITGATTSGRTTVAIAALAQATTEGEACAWVDGSSSFDPASAAAQGADLRQLLWVRANYHLEHALKTVDLLLHAGGFGLIVLDLCDISERAFSRVPVTFWYRARRAVEQTPAVLLVLGETPHVKNCAAYALDLEQEDTAWTGNLLRSVRYRPRLRKPIASLRPGMPFEAVASA